MTLQEYEEKLREITPEEFQKFNVDFGGGQKTVEQRIREYVDHPEHERRICQLLGLKTEAEKLTDAAINSANSTNHNWLVELSKHPLTIGIICVIITVVLGALLSTHLQNKRDSQEKQTELIKTFAKLYKGQSQNMWALYHAANRNDRQGVKDYTKENRDIISQYSGLIQEMKIYFNEEPELIQNIKDFTDIWHGVYTKIAQGQASVEYINQQSKIAENIRNKIEFRVSNILIVTPGLLPLWQPKSSGNSSNTSIAPLDASPEVIILERK